MTTALLCYAAVGVYVWLAGDGLDALPLDYPGRWQTYLSTPGADRYRVGEYPGYRAATALWLRWPRPIAP